MFPSEQVNNAVRRERKKNEPPENKVSGALTVFELSPFSLFTLAGGRKMNARLAQMACYIAYVLLAVPQAQAQNCCQ